MGCCIFQLLKSCSDPCQNLTACQSLPYHPPHWFIHASLSQAILQFPSAYYSLTKAYPCLSQPASHLDRLLENSLRQAGGGFGTGLGMAGAD